MPASSHVFLNVADLEKSVEFYRGLGFRTGKEYKDRSGATNYVDLDRGGAELSLGRIGANDDPEFQNWVSTPLGAGVIVFFAVPDVDRVYEKAQDMGATIEAPITDRSYGRGFNLNDPDGYVVSFITEPRRRGARKPAAAKPAKAKARATRAKAPAARRKGKRARRR